MSKTTKYCMRLIVVPAMGLAVLLFVGCHRPSSQLVTGHSETAGQASADDDLEDHCFKQEPPEERKSKQSSKTVVVILTLPGVNPDNLHPRLLNLNNAANGKPYEDITDKVMISKNPLGGGKIAVTIEDKPPTPLRSHLGPGPYMVVASAPSGAKYGGKPTTLFYYYETYQSDLSDCAKYHE